MTSKYPVRDRIRYVQHHINVVNIQYNCNKISKTVYYDQLDGRTYFFGNLNIPFGFQCGYNRIHIITRKGR